MPTGYTAPVADGEITDLRSFAMLCARGMSALVTVRDAGWDAPIPEKFEPGNHAAKRLAESKAERDRLYALTDEEADAAAKAEFENDKDAKAKYFADKAARRARYEAMIALVEPWQRAPEGLKEFMLDQLRTGLEFDCPVDGFYWKEPALLSGPEWRASKLDKVQRDIARDYEEDAKERARTDSRNAWLKQLRAALPEPEPTQ
jgi:hypothetical protein